MVNLVTTLATLAAALMAVAAFVTLASGRHVISGTFLVFTAFAIYIRETNK